MYVYKRPPTGKGGTWQEVFVRGTDPHFRLVFSRPNLSGKTVKAAYEDTRHVPKSPLLHKLDAIGFFFPRS